MVYPVGWLVIILVRLLFSKRAVPQTEVRRSFMIAILRVFAFSVAIILLSQLGIRGLPFGVLVAAYIVPGLVLDAVLIPLRLPRVAYYFARVAWPLGFSDADGVVASYYAARALRPERDAHVIAKLERVLSETPSRGMNGGAVVTLGLLALAKKNPEQARQLFQVAHTLNSRFISRGPRALARDYLVVEAVRAGAYRTTIALGVAQTPTLRWAYFVARASQRLLRDPSAPSNFNLWMYYLMAPRRRATFSLLRRALDVSPPPQPTPGAQSKDQDLPSALAALAAALRNLPRTNTPQLNALLNRIDAALADPKTDASIQRRLLALNCNDGVDAVLARFLADLVARLVPAIEASDELSGGIPLTPILDEAFDDARRSAFRELSALCSDYRRRTDARDGFDTDVEWKLWANFRARAERIIRIDPSAGDELFAQAFIPICNFAVLQHNQYKALALAHSMYAWLHQYAESSPTNASLLAKNMKAAT